MKQGFSKLFSVLVTITVAAGGACSDSDKPSSLPGPDAGASGPDASVDVVSDISTGGDGAGVSDGADVADQGDSAGGSQDGSIPDTHAGRQFAWLLQAINTNLKDVTDTDLASHFTETFLKAIPVAEIRTLFSDIAKNSAPFVLYRFEQQDDDALVAVASDKSGKYARILLSTEPVSRFRIAGLFFQAAGNADPSLDTWEEVEPALKAIAPSVNMLVASLEGDSCEPIRSIEPERPLALGSTFKLYVLDALARSIRAGEHTWTEPLAIREGWKSLPSGKMQDAAAGTLYTLRSYAEGMISISDNTATDHLLYLLGRPAVEAVMQATGHHNPSLNTPFLATRELFLLKGVLTEEQRASYVAANASDRRAMLEQLESKDFTGFQMWTSPLLIDKLEWFASPRDLCKLMADLKAMSAQPVNAPLSEILSINPALPDTNGLFRYVGYKGGSEPGVLNMTYVLQRKVDDKWFFFTVGFNNAQKAISDDDATYVIQAARDLIAK